MFDPRSLGVHPIIPTVAELDCFIDITPASPASSNPCFIETRLSRTRSNQDSYLDDQPASLHSARGRGGGGKGKWLGCCRLGISMSAPDTRSIRFYLVEPYQSAHKPHPFYVFLFTPSFGTASVVLLPKRGASETMNPVAEQELSSEI